MKDKTKENTSIMGIAMLVVILFTPFTIIGLIIGVFDTDVDVYEKTYLQEDKKIFGKYNNDYKDETDENSRKIILEFGEGYSKEANKVVMNYISNVNGYLEGINDTKYTKNTMKPMYYTGIGTSGQLKPGIAWVNGSSTTNKTRFIIRVPRDAVLADNLQERMDLYLKCTK